MTLLWLVAMGLPVLALLLIVPPLVRSPARQAVAQGDTVRRVHTDRLARIESDFATGALSAQGRAQAIEEVQRQVLEAPPPGVPRASVSWRPWMGWGVAGVLSVGLPAAALVLYLQVGDPVAAATQMVTAQEPGAHVGEGADVERMVGGLAARLRAQPDDLAGWTMLARSYAYLERFDDAAVAYRSALALASVSDQPDLLADYADTLASAQQGAIDGPAQAAIDAALAIDPNHHKALALAGMAALRRGDVAQARVQWEKVLALLPPDAEAAQRIGADLAQLDAGSTPAAPPATQRAAHAGKHVAGSVSVAAALYDAAPPQATVFVLARAAAAGRMPVAVLRLQVKDLPAKFVLDDSLAMSPDVPISRFDAVTLEVRVSRSGQAMPQSGDLAGSLTSVPLGADGLDLQADQVVR